MYRVSRSLAFASLASGVACAALLSASSCGSSSSSDSSAALTVAIADTPLDDVTSFNVKVTGITLFTSAGAPHVVLATAVPVDLATLTNFSQVLDLGLIDPGSYTKASVTLDFTGATCFLTGQTTAAALNDDAGVPLTGSMTLPIDFTAHPFTAVDGHHHVLELDFNFNQALTVDLTGNSVEVVPTFQARFDRPDQNALVAYGQGVSLNISTSSAILQLEGISKVQLQQMALGFTANTVYQVNGVTFLGAAGLSALGTQPIGVWIQAFGFAQPGSQSITVTYLEAAKGSFNGGQDVIDGYVVDRTGGGAGADPTLTVVGTSSNSAGAVTHFNTQFFVDASHANTKTVLRGSSLVFTTDALDVGQHVQAFGTLAGNTLDATATTGIVRAIPTPLSGTAVATPVGTTLVLAVTKVGPLDQALFTWADSGTNPPDPNNFSIDIGTLANGLTIDPATPLVVSCNMSAVDTSTADATATLVTDAANGPFLMSLRDRAAGFTVVTDTTGGQIQFTITGVQGADETASIDKGFQGVIALPVAPNPTIVASATPVFYVLFHSATNASESFTVFADFVTALGTALAGTETVRDVVASGPYDGINNVVGADYATVVLQ